jgi:hypothetical protein
MNTKSFVFHSVGKRYAVTFMDIKVAGYDPGYRVEPTVDNDGNEVFRKTYAFKKAGSKRYKRYARFRYSTLCIVRTAYTGIPYSGIALVHPDEIRQSRLIDNKIAANELAAKRALKALFQNEYKNENGRGRALYRVAYNEFLIEHGYHTGTGSIERTNLLRDEIERITENNL